MVKTEKDIPYISSIIVDTWPEMRVKSDLYGLAVCGGKSSRMGTDKSNLVYYGRAQKYHVADMLATCCSRVFISCNAQQKTSIDADYLTLTDSSEFPDAGPVTALLTAFSIFPGQDFLVIGTDYPLLSIPELQLFMTSIQRKTLAAAFYNPDGFYEPLLAWYSKNCYQELRRLFEKGEYSIQRFLQNSGAEKYRPGFPQIMTSVDTTEDYERMKEFIKSGQSITRSDI
ncbi:Molybdenum cofactor guanylyltransferase [Dyadobacter sp. CECT 9275]|uniref:Molybdenum cofactor guanylyltransferase n=1 Tax=Dyadobacter helix TaxID=2822344 RepID=A0A916JDN3_9BACT|nr:molybdenum cofactor guanylyltransferase [Dyadobacter sp. CECT 9275]CAG5003776.1 Molybdenum cofactor guanylyltransferase [Dyadobacter sp. CECT 9275]